MTGWNSAGAPIYGDFPLGQIVGTMPPRVTELEGRWGGWASQDTQTGDVYAAVNDAVPDWGRSKDSFLLKYRPDGTMEWQVGRKGDEPGQIGVFRRILGFTHGCIALTNFSLEWPQEHLTRTYVWDKDGLWAGKLMDNPNLKNIPAWRYALGGEALAGMLYTNPQTGDVLWFAHWLNEGRIYRITGWNGWERASGKINLRTIRELVPPNENRWNEVAFGTGTGLNGEYWDNQDMEGESVLKRLDPTIDFTWGLYDANPTQPVKRRAGYIVRWTGQVQPLQSGAYTFLLAHPATGAIWVDGTLVFGPYPSGPERNHLITLVAGKKYDIRVEYSTKNGHPSFVMGAKLQWVEPSGMYPSSAKIIPASQLYPAHPAETEKVAP